MVAVGDRSEIKNILHDVNIGDYSVRGDREVEGGMAPHIYLYLVLSQVEHLLTHVGDIKLAATFRGDLFFEFADHQTGGNSALIDFEDRK